ncbi:hypothetical protein [Bdellovibrio svalbardensis]|uniref:Uncharacterized protein n=1 Tax=Bdellovibrio svalbardensis TaxID=2972972 RepID=A0ABT6DPA7_9BACT|nr:hypothetical protein [Bdellovibrio svalbardensis]MDG0817910.1 hypothetical protein [Bdellovibrio svalbardensis]
MSMSVLSQASAFNPGSDLWIVPQLEKSQWTARLDWYLNFQICKSSRHKMAHTPLFVNEVIKEAELDTFYRPVNAQAPLMIASEQLLPNKWVVVVPWANDMTAWSKEVFQVWSGLQEPTLRIFLPPGQSAGLFQQAWVRHHSSEEFTVVLD